MEEQQPTPELQARLALWKLFRERGITAPVRVKWDQDLQLDLILGNDQSRCLYVCGSFEPNELVFVRDRLAPGMVFMDVGAAEGFYTAIAARSVGENGRILAFEPSPRERGRLERNIHINGFKNVEVFDYALAEMDGETTFRIAEAEHNGQNTLGYFAYEGVVCAAELNIQLRTLDGIVADSRLARIDLIKMDVEGAEFRVLQGALQALRRFKPIILMELLEPALRNQHTSPGEVLQLLGSLGYEIRTFDERTGQPRRANPEEVLSSNIVAVPIA